MKRRDLVRHLESQGCELLREGARHPVYVNRRTRNASAVPRPRELNEHLARKICRDLEVPPPAAV
ncbi:MAG TPA: type II toxin-antitoxin system HicA family toxin [Myxococcota bacterium]|nr:type II toxin-antitoxin system HicA family toxin [Myxococcota bacterium]